MSTTMAIRSTTTCTARQCNKLIEFRCDQMAQIAEELSRQYQFRVTGHRLIFTGICAECRAKKRPTRKLDLV